MTIHGPNIKKVATNLFLLVVLCSANPGVAEEVDQRLDVMPDGIVKIQNLRGEIVVKGWDKHVVQVQGDLDELAEGLRFETNGHVTVIEVVMPKQNVNWGDASDLNIYVPDHSKVSVDSVSADLNVERVLGGLKLRTISGEIELKNAGPRVHLNTVSGSISVSQTGGKLHASSSSGEIEIGEHEGALDVESLSGDVTVADSKITRMRGATVSGSLETEIDFTEIAVAEFTSVSGDVNLRIGKPHDFNLKVNTNSGDIDNNLSDDRVTEDFGMKSLRARLGTADGVVSVRTVSGSIEIEED